MEIKNCTRCGKIYNFMGKNICPFCEKKEEEEFIELRKCIDDNPGLRIQEIADLSGVSAKRIIRYIKEGRLQISVGMHGEIHCETCGKAISRGRFCDTCVIKINQEMVEEFSTSRSKRKEIRVHTEGRI